MSQREETRSVLRMLQEGKINAEQAENLLEALREAAKAAPTAGREEPASSSAGALRESIRSQMEEAVRKGLGRFALPQDRARGRWREGGETSQQPLELKAGEKVKITSELASVEVVASEAEKVCWKGQGGVEVERTAAGTRIRVDDEGGVRGLQVFVSLDHPVEVQTGVGGVEVAERGADTTIRSECGRVTVREVRGDVFVETDTGKVEVEACDGERIEVETDTGDVRLHLGSFGSLKCSSDTGDIDLEGSAGKSVELETDTGDIGVSVASLDALKCEADMGDVSVAISAPFRGEAEVETDQGDIQLSLNRESHARVRLQTEQGELSDQIGLEHAKRGPGHVQGVLGDGQGSVSLEADQGDVTLKATAGA